MAAICRFLFILYFPKNDDIKMEYESLVFKTMYIKDSILYDFMIYYFILYT